MSRRIAQIALICCCFGHAAAQTPPLKPYDVYRAIGLAVSVPATWTHDGITTTTKAEFIRKFGFNYDKADNDEIWRAHGRFSLIEVDSTLIPSDSAYALHFFTIFVERSRTLYKQWLCRHGKETLFSEMDFVPPGATIAQAEDIGPPRQLQDGWTVYGKAYELTKEGVTLPIVGRIYSFNHEEQCYSIKLESTAPDRRNSIRMHERIANSLEVIN